MHHAANCNGIDDFPSIGIGIEVCQIRGIGIAQMIFWVLVLTIEVEIYGIVCVWGIGLAT